MSADAYQDACQMRQVLQQLLHDWGFQAVFDVLEELKHPVTADADKKLTPTQARVFDIIRSYMVREGCPPTRVEITQALGAKSSNTAEEHLQALQRKGYITLTRGVSRGIRLVPRP